MRETREKGIKGDKKKNGEIKCEKEKRKGGIYRGGEREQKVGR